MRTLHLTLKKEWYEKIERGEKLEEYREIKPYWIKRLCFYHKQEGCLENDCKECFNDALCDCCYTCYPFEEVCFHFGYTKRTMRFKIESITYGFGRPEWGAPKGKMVFIIKLKSDGASN